jgi:isoquinoline 1-oxidoreductase beta subunit
MTWIRRVSRREFLRATGIVGGGLILGVHLQDQSEIWDVVGAAQAQDAATSFPANVFLAIETDGTTIIWVSRSEMGQGTRTGMPMILAEELDADWDTIHIVQGDADERYGHQLTGGSLSTRLMWDPLRQAGATARWMLLQAAAQRWGVDVGACRTETGAVRHEASGRRATYGELSAEASRLDVPTSVHLKTNDAYRLLGTAKPRIDTPRLVQGAPVFGIDTHLDDLRVAAVARCPFSGGRLRDVDDSAARAIPGVLDIVRVHGSQEGMTRPEGVAVVATDTWTAFEAVRALQIEWDAGPHEHASTDALFDRMRGLEDFEGEVLRNDGDVDTALREADRVVEARYELPFLAHAPMEPQNTTVHVEGDRCTVWTPTQNPQTVQRAVAQVLGLPASSVQVHVTLIGGGFGRRLYPDMEIEAALIARHVDAPVSVVWSREDDIHHDRFRPASVHVLRGGLDARGVPRAWHWDIRNTHPGRFVHDDFPAWAFAHYRVHYRHVPWILPRGAWRSTVHSQNPFVIQCFLDELAAAGDQDPLELRLRLLHDRRRPETGDPPYRNERLIRVLERVGEMADWGRALPDGVGRGVSFNTCYDSYVAQVAEVSLQEGAPRVQRVLCAVDCGQVTNPDLVQAQIEGGTLFGLSAALLQQITVQQGRVVQDNFHNFRTLRAGQAPEIVGSIIASTERPGGMGEVCVTPVASAVGNAIFDAAGERRRSMPLGAA